MKSQQFPRELRKKLYDKVWELAQMTEDFQECPNTMAQMTIATGHFELSALGWAKVSYPDEWNSEEGYQVAEQKAINKLVKKILESDEAYVYIEALGLPIDEQLLSFRVVAESLV